MPISIIIADDQSAHLARLKKSWERSLSKAVRYETTSDLKSVEEKLRDRPHVVIVDNQFESASNEGVTFIATHKPRHPDTLFVLMTGFGFDVEQLGQRVPNPDIIVPKPYLLVDSYLDHIGKEIISRLRRSPIAVSPPTVGLREVEITREAFSSLVEQCVCSLEVLNFTVDPEPTAEFELLSGGYSGAVVYQMKLRGEGRSPALPLVIKCGSRGQIQRELRAFEGWVRWQLPHDMRVDVIGRGSTGDHAAICYGFVLGSSEKLCTMKKAIQEKDHELVKRALRRIIFAERTGWYGPIRVGDSDLRTYLLNRHEYAPGKDERRNNQFRQAMTRISDEEKLSFSISAGDIIVDGSSYGSIRRTIAAVSDGAVKLVYCHGDMNANNIFMDETHGGLALIDFEQSGENHIFRDVISVETSSRMDLPEAETRSIKFSDLVNLEHLLLCDREVVPENDYAEWMRSFRTIARERYSTATSIEYVIPLVLHSWKVLGVRKWPDEVERRLCAVVLAGLRRLKNLAERRTI